MAMLKKTIISHNTAFGDIITNTFCAHIFYEKTYLVIHVYYCNAKIVHIHKYFVSKLVVLLCKNEECYVLFAED